MSSPRRPEVLMGEFASASAFAPAPAAPGEHVVFFTVGGDPAAERYPSLEAAVDRVGALANEHGVQDATVFALVPIPLQVRQRWHVEVGTAATPPVPAPRTEEETVPATVSPTVPATQEGAEVADDETLEAPVEAAGDVLPTATAPRGRGMGFFVH